MWQWALLPICLAVFGTAGVWAVFAISVSNGSVNLTEGFPYISECGTHNPQSCLFSQICNIFAFLAVWVVVIRFQQVRDCGGHGVANIISIILGFISCLGLSLLGNFQKSVLVQIHLLGAFGAFFLGMAYFWVQLFLTYRVHPGEERRWVGPLRAVCCIFTTVLVIGMTVLVELDHHSPAAVCEWALVMLFFVLFGLFGVEFRHVDCHSLTVQNSAFTPQTAQTTL